MGAFRNWIDKTTQPRPFYRTGAQEDTPPPSYKPNKESTFSSANVRISVSRNFLGIQRSDGSPGTNLELTPEQTQQLHRWIQQGQKDKI
jgi:hypothetical protein